MAITVTVNGVDYTSRFVADGSSFATRAHMGESVQGQLIFEDNTGSELNHVDFAARKIVIVTENASGTSKTLLRGRVANKQFAHGDIELGHAQRWTVQVEDYNIDLKGIRVDSSARSAETDYTRVLAYRNGYLNGASSTNANKRTTTALGTTYLLNTEVYNLPANTYTDTYVDAVLQEIAEISGKDFFVTVDGELFYAPRDSTAYASDISISDAALAADGVDVFAPIAASVDHDGQYTITGGSVRYGTGLFYEASNIYSAEADHDKWEEHFSEANLTTAAEAVAFVTNMVDSRDNERFSFQCTIMMRANQVHRIAAGMTLPVTLQSCNLPSPSTQRVVSCTKFPWKPGTYLVDLVLGFPRDPPLARTRRPNAPVAPTPAQSEVLTGYEYWTWETNRPEPVANPISGPSTAALTGYTQNGGFGPMQPAPEGVFSTWRGSGSGAFTAPPTIGSGGFLATVAAVAGTTYRFAGYRGVDIAFGQSGDGRMGVGWYDSSGALIISNTIAGTGGQQVWEAFSTDAVAPPGATGMGVYTQDQSMCVDAVRISVVVTPASSGTAPTTVGGTGEGSYGTPGVYVPAGSVLEHSNITVGGPYHEAADVTFSPTGTISSTNVQAAIAEVASEAASSGIQATIVDAKGDLIAATAADTVARHAVGSNDQVLTADSAQSTGLAWQSIQDVGYWSELTNGDAITPELIFADGDTIDVWVPT